MTLSTTNSLTMAGALHERADALAAEGGNPAEVEALRRAAFVYARDAAMTLSREIGGTP